MARYICLRFDVDTELCLREGVPRLLDLGAELNCRFTFFVNPGKAISRSRLIREGLTLKGRQRCNVAPHLGSIRKLGLSEMLWLLVRNPETLPRHARILRSASSQGHEIGLHGGRNHGLWQRDAHRWSTSRLRYEIAWGKRRLEDCGLGPIDAFASPGWNGPEHMANLLQNEGFKVWADSHGEFVDPSKLDAFADLTLVPTALTGEPGGVGMIEYYRARGYNDDAIEDDVRLKLEGEQSMLCLYDHPFYAGRHEINILRRILKTARSLGREVVPLGGALPSH